MEESKVIVSHCNQCDKDWTPRVDNPACCPRCKRYDWREPKKGVRERVATGTEGQALAEKAVKILLEKRPELRPSHDPKTCKVHRCGLCAVAGKEK